MDVLNPYSAFMSGRNQAMDMAKNRADLILKQIEANRKNEMIDAEMAARKQQLENSKMQAEAYARQVAIQERNANAGKPYDDARAAQLQREGSFAPLNSIYEVSQNNIPLAAHMYNQLPNKPADLRALELPQEATFENQGQPPVMSRFNPEAMRSYLEGMGRPKSVADIQKTEMQQQGAMDRTQAQNQSREEIARITAEAKAGLEAVKAGQVTKENYEQWVTRQEREGAIDRNTAINLIVQARQAAASIAPGQYKPIVDVKKYGVPTLPSPAEQRGQASQQNISPPSGWSVRTK